MKKWNKMTEKSRNFWSVIILLLIILVIFGLVLLIIKWLIPFIFNTAIKLVVWIFVILVFALALNH